jgi:single-stranded DNA-binding protein
MSLFLLASGTLLADPLQREGAKGPFTTAKIRANGDEAVLVSVIGFGAEAEQLLRFAKGDGLAVSGPARLTSWTSRDGTEKHGISLIAEQIAGAKPKPRSARSRPAAASRQFKRNRRYSPPKTPGTTEALSSDSVTDLWAAAVEAVP